MRMKRTAALVVAFTIAAPAPAFAATPDTSTQEDSFLSFLSNLFSGSTVEPVGGTGGFSWDMFGLGSTPAPQQAPAWTWPAQSETVPPAPSASSGKPMIGVFAHDGTAGKPGNGKVGEFEDTIGRKVDLWQIAPQREKGDGVLLSETEATLSKVPAGTAVDYAFPIEGAGMGAGMSAKLGQALAPKTDAPVYVRPGWEFNLEGSWSWTTDRIGDQAFIDGFRATADGIRSTCPNCKIVWNPNTGQGGVDRAMQAWPGDEYVDVIGIDAYDWANEDPMDGPGQLNEWAAKARELGKPIALPEWGAHGKQGRGDNPAFINDVFDWVERNRDSVVYISYFSEDLDGYIDNVPSRQLRQVGEALRERVSELDSGTDAATTVPDLTVPATPVTPELAVPEPPTTGAPSTTPTVEAGEQELTDARGVTSTAQVWPTASPRGLVVHLDGDGQHGVRNPDDSYSLGGSDGIVATAQERGYAVAALTPPGGAETWWENGEANAAWAADAIGQLQRQTGAPAVTLVGYSGGAQLITEFLLPAHGAQFAGATAVVIGGGTPGDTSNVPDNIDVHFYTGTDDTAANADDGFDAVGAARDGADAYRAAGVNVTLDTPAGVNHDLSGRFGAFLARYLP